MEDFNYSSSLILHIIIFGIHKPQLNVWPKAYSAHFQNFLNAPWQVNYVICTCVHTRINYTDFLANENTCFEDLTQKSCMYYTIVMDVQFLRLKKHLQWKQNDITVPTVVWILMVQRSQSLCIISKPPIKQCPTPMWEMGYLEMMISYVC